MVCNTSGLLCRRGQGRGTWLGSMLGGPGQGQARPANPGGVVVGVQTKAHERVPIRSAHTSV